MPAVKWVYAYQVLCSSGAYSKHRVMLSWGRLTVQRQQRTTMYVVNGMHHHRTHLAVNSARRFNLEPMHLWTCRCDAFLKVYNIRQDIPPHAIDGLKLLKCRHWSRQNASKPRITMLIFYRCSSASARGSVHDCVRVADVAKIFVGLQPRDGATWVDANFCQRLRGLIAVTATVNRYVLSV